MTRRRCRFASFGFLQLCCMRERSAGLRALSCNLPNGFRLRAIRRASSCELVSSIKQGNGPPHRCTNAAPESITVGLRRPFEGAKSSRRNRPPLSKGQGPGGDFKSGGLSTVGNGPVTSRPKGSIGADSFGIPWRPTIIKSLVFGDVCVGKVSVTTPPVASVFSNGRDRGLARQP